MVPILPAILSDISKLVTEAADLVGKSEPFSRTLRNIKGISNDSFYYFSVRKIGNVLDHGFFQGNPTFQLLERIYNIILIFPSNKQR